MSAPAIAAEDIQALTDSLKRLLAEQGPEAEVRRVMETPEGYDPTLWAQLAEMGVVGLIVDEAYGGVGAGPVELERVTEETGAALLCAPLISSGVLAAGLLHALDDEPAKARRLPGIAAGTTIATAALTGCKGLWTEAAVEARASQGPDGGWRLEGAAAFVTDAAIADVILVAAHAPDAIGIFELAAGPRSEGLQIRPQRTFDRTLRLADVVLTSAPALRLQSAGPVWEAVEAALDLARVALAGEQAGGARRSLEMTVDYAKLRVQFGRPIGSFQAIKHMAADLKLEMESAVSAARHAAESLARGAPDARAAVDLAAFACADAFSAVTAASVQMHGGIAFTWTHPAHLYLRRARADAQLFGAPAAYRERYLTAMGG